MGINVSTSNTARLFKSLPIIPMILQFNNCLKSSYINIKLTSKLYKYSVY